MKTTGLKMVALSFLFIDIASQIALADKTPSTQPARDQWKLTWSDEFNAAKIDRTKWDFDTGTGFFVPPAAGKPGQWVAGWGNSELENYTDRRENAFVKDGALHLKAIKENYKDSHYTSARLRTGGKGKTGLFTQQYGRFEFRAKLPTGQGLWPAIWLLPQDETYGGWAASGEIDLMEARDQFTDQVQGTLHYGLSSPKNVWSGQQYLLPDHGSIADFHIYSLDWEPGEIRMSVDGKAFFTRNFWFSKTGDKENAWPAPFDQPFYILLNVAVGGQFGGNPNETTSFPQEMVVDYVRVYEKADGDKAIKPRGAGDVGSPSRVGKAGE